MYYIHPNLNDPSATNLGGTILDLENGILTNRFPYSTPEGSITEDFDKYFKDLAKMSELRTRLGIPVMSYHAHSFPRIGYDCLEVGKLIAWARKTYETRWWIVYESALVLICIADSDLSENAGWDFYQRGKDIPGRVSFHCPAWWEFCMHGTLIPPDWLMRRGPTDLVTLTSPDQKFGMVVGGV